MRKTHAEVGTTVVVNRSLTQIIRTIYENISKAKTEKRGIQKLALRRKILGMRDTKTDRCVWKSKAGRQHTIITA